MGACARVHVRAREGCVRNTLQPPSPSPLPPSHSTAACLLFVVHLKPRQVAVGVAQALSLCAGRRPSVHVYRVRGWVGRGATVPGVLATPPPPAPSASGTCRVRPIATATSSGAGCSPPLPDSRKAS